MAEEISMAQKMKKQKWKFGWSHTNAILSNFLHFQVKILMEMRQNKDFFSSANKCHVNFSIWKFSLRHREVVEEINVIGLNVIQASFMNELAPLFLLTPRFTLICIWFMPHILVTTASRTSIGNTWGVAEFSVSSFSLYQAAFLLWTSFWTMLISIFSTHIKPQHGQRYQDENS